MNIRFIVMGFQSHQIWAEGYQRFAERNKKHKINLEIISGERWKFRMLTAASEIESRILPSDDIVVIDGMLDASLLVAMLKQRLGNKQKVLVYLHENQLTTPFSSQDRDVKNQTHWHYGMAHYRSLLVVDGFVFNSETHKQAFVSALPKLLKEQMPERCG
mmetsp:Transcript_21547/g.26445  ORF Transcript_21547/g.26445 Transcript_21547/m.26445 type:complete len:160 (+) Transcript_21547:116-595(+)